MVKTSSSERLIDVKVYENIDKLMNRHINIKMGKNCRFSKQEILGTVIYTATNENTLNKTSPELAKYLLRINGHPTDVPSCGTVFYHLEKLDVNGVSADFDKMNNKIIGIAKRRHLINKEVIGAFDFHKQPCYAKRDKKKVKKRNKKGEVKMLPLVGMERKNNTNYGLCWATVDIVTKDEKFTISAKEVTQLTNRAEIFDQCLTTALKRRRIKILLFDSEICKVPYLKVLNRHRTKFISGIAIQGDELKEFVRDAKNYLWKVKKHTFTAENGETATVNVVSYMKPEKKGEKSLTPPEPDFFVYATNLDITSYAQAIYFGELYRERWEIEIGYRVKKDFLIPTTATTYVVRLFFFLLSVALYNLWFLFNMLSKKHNWFGCGARHFTTHDFKVSFMSVFLFDVRKADPKDLAKG